MKMVQVKEDLLATFEQVKNAVGWTVDKRIALSIASYYVTTGKTFDGKRFLATSDVIKQKSSWTSPLRSHIHYMMAAFLTKEDEDPSVSIDNLRAKKESLKSAGFKTNVYSYLAAILMSDEKSLQDVEATQAKLLYDAMKAHHPFLTQPDDVPYAVMLGRLPGEAKERAATMNRYYTELRPQGFYMGNELQWMSQILTYTSPSYQANIVGQAVHIRDQLKSAGIKIKSMHYVMVGFLAALEIKDEELQHVIETYRQLETMKFFTWYKDMILPIAVQLETKHIIDNEETASVSFATTIEMMMQAQQAAIIASMAATNAAVASSGGGE
ncbi:DUF4003 domain-containing protein [Paenisporosarcina quisquiliarum]|uniref:DUF4003 domain-containing protein n=1 Tax=Paenisporosarcina quisquiliarum TaxID=365346 RepID=A0A9X3LIP8_9BACL|nr:DUF4003 family protein [Paenisporosarcina quisquiliarum]MCZ8537754.1 DUF4003 domain-containing protein [Paenisporosarcina quisquiliarum]